MRNPEPDLDVNGLTWLPGLDVRGWVVGELEAFAEPEVAKSGLVFRAVFGSELGETFDVRGVVEADVLFDFGAAVCYYCGASWAGWRGGNEAMGEYGGD